MAVTLEGQGTEDSPYLVSNPAELRAAVEIADCYIKLKTDIDFNDDTVIWGWEPLMIYCKQIDGNNHKITNCYCYQKSFMIGCVGENNPFIMKNTIIEAIYLTSASQSTGTGATNGAFIFPSYYNIGRIHMFFYDCDFRIKYYVEKDDAFLFYNAVSFNNGMVFIRRCIINLDIFPNNHDKINIFRLTTTGAESSLISNNEIKINLHLANNLFTGKSAFNTDTSKSATFYALLHIFYTSNGYPTPYFTNNATFINIDGINENLPSKLCILLSYSKSISNCYFILNDVKSNYLSSKEIHFKIPYGGACSTSCFMNNKAKFYNQNLTNNEPNMHILTDEQCKNLQELLNIGFLVV